jgi:acetoin utilization deacetylase AcuC-like enzyme
MVDKPVIPPIVFARQSAIDIGAHVFPIRKYKDIYARLINEIVIEPDSIIQPQPVTPEMILAVHDESYWNDFSACKWTAHTETSEFPLFPGIVDFFTASSGGTLTASRLALRYGMGINIGGGFHHAFPGHAEGFCYLNDIAIAIKQLRKEKAVNKTFILDCDVHQGNGTAYIFKDDPDVFTFSIHQQNTYPIKQKSSLDIGLEDGAMDVRYLSVLEKYIPSLWREFKPDLIIYVAGADPFENDQLGGLKISIEGLLKRDTLILENSMKERIPVSIVLGGGYAVDTKDTVQIHFNTCKKGIELYQKYCLL